MERQGLPTLNHLLQHTLRSLCTDSQWVYAVFWRILPRNYPPPQWETEGGAMDRTKGNKRNWILVWEDGFCNFSACLGAAKEAKAGNHFLGGGIHRGSEDDSEAMHPELFFKMSHEVYNYGEGLMGKVAADNSHKWVYREPMEHEISFLSPWHGSLDPHPRTWEGQFKSGIQTIAVVAVQEGLLQLGSVKKVVEDLNFVILMQRKFNYLQSIPGVFVPHPTSHSSSKKRTQNGEGSPPTDGDHWISLEERLMSNGLNPRSVDQFLSPRTGLDGWRSSSITTQDTSILGIKRPPDTDTPLSLNFKDYPYISSGNLQSYMTGSYDGRPECPSPPKALNTGQSSPQGSCSPSFSNLLPSMSSLQALLSKLPSVTSNESDAGLGSPMQQLSPSPPSSGYDSPPTNFSVNWPQVRQPLSRPPSSQDLPSTADANGLSDVTGTGATAAMRSSRSSDLCNGSRASTSNGSAGSAPSDDLSEGSEPSQQEGDLQRAVLYQHINQSKEIAPALKDKLSSFLDTFDTLSDFGLHQALENSDNYNSFFSEIYRD